MWLDIPTPLGMIVCMHLLAPMWANNNHFPITSTVLGPLWNVSPSNLVQLNWCGAWRVRVVMYNSDNSWNSPSLSDRLTEICSYADWQLRIMRQPTGRRRLHFLRERAGPLVATVCIDSGGECLVQARLTMIVWQFNSISIVVSSYYWFNTISLECMPDLVENFHSYIWNPSYPITAWLVFILCQHNS